MKLAKINKAMTRMNRYIVTGEDGFQWLGDGTAFYQVDQGLDLTEGNLLAILDIDEDKRGNYNVREIDGARLPQCDICPREGEDEQLHPLVSVSWAGELVTIMTTAEGEAAAVPQRQVVPADGREPLTFFLRRAVDPQTGEIKAPCVAVFRDMLCCAVIMPVKRETMDEMWIVMRKACWAGLEYVVPGEAVEDGEET